MAEHRYFPMFIDTAGKTVLVIGGGTVAERRILTLLEFGFQIEVIAERLTDRLRGLAEDGRFRYVRGSCGTAGAPDDAGQDAVAARKGTAGAQAEARKGTAGAQAEASAEDAAPAPVPLGEHPADILLACTDDRELNRRIGEYGRSRRIPVNVCDAREESTFWFPAVALNDELTMGLVGNGASHGTVRQAAAMLREIITGKEYRK